MSYLQCPPMPGAHSRRSRSSGSSTSSLSSTFSDITSSTSASSSSSPPASKTSAFFASPFSTRPPSPAHSTPPAAQAAPIRSLTADFFATPARPPSPPTSTATKQNSYVTSRIFPSRYTSTDSFSHGRTRSSGSESSFTSSSPVHTRLPTPPPPHHTLHRENTIVPALRFGDDQSTPRPPDLEPGLLRFERSLLLAAQANQNVKPEPEPEPLEDYDEDEEPHSGSLISIPPFDPPPSPLPLSPLSITFTIAPPDERGTPTPTPTNEPSINAPTIRLSRPLGHGAFSSVWLAEDLSRVPLTLISKKSVRDLRRRASGRDKEKQQEERDREIAPHVCDTEEVGKRAPSRLKELRNMLSFTRAPPRFPTVPSPGANLSRSPAIRSPASPHFEPLSRQPSFQSSTSNGSTLSRTSSVDTDTPPSSRPASLKLPISEATTLSRDSSLKKFRERVRGTRPTVRLGRSYLDERHGEMGKPRDHAGEDGMRLSRQSSLNKDKTNGRLVAVKMTPRKVRGMRGREKEEEERTRVGFVREVEVLKHISHPNITPLLAHLSTSTHHILVLPYLSGGDLLGLVNNDVAWGKLGESVLRRIWCELCKAVGWMHGVGLVHRDIKLENILLTVPAFSSLSPSSPRPTLSSLPPPPLPLIKLTDFGLSRFVEIDAKGDAELLSTRCGSEAYAAPELVTGGRGVYDARKTDAWACGVVLYALVGRLLPFGEGVDKDGMAGAVVGGGRIGGERGEQQGFANARASLAERRQWLIRIARGEWVWPGDDAAEDGVQEEEDDEHELVGLKLVKSKGARRLVSRLLVRDTKKRARIGDVWDDVWMCGGEDEGWWRRQEEEQDAANESSGHLMDVDHDHDHHEEWSFEEDDVKFYDEPTGVQPLDHGDDGSLEHSSWSDEDVDGGYGYGYEEEEEQGGCLFDHEGIDSITRQEVV